MSDTKRFKAPSKKAIDWYATKYDGFKLVKRGEYKHQKGSGRSQCFELAKDGMMVGTWTKKCAEYGFDPKFPVNCVQKLMTTKDPAWVFSDTNDKGLTVKEVTGARSVERAEAKKEKKAKKEAKPKAPKAKAKEVKAAPKKRIKGVNPDTNRIENAAE